MARRRKGRDPGRSSVATLRLHMAARGHAEVLQLLLDHGAASASLAPLQRPIAPRRGGQLRVRGGAARRRVRADAADEDGDASPPRGAEQEVASALEQRKRFLQVTPEHKAAAVTLKDAANERFRDGDFASAVAMYRMTRASIPYRAACNIAAALLKMEDFPARRAAASAVAIDSGYARGTKSLYRHATTAKYDDAGVALLRPRQPVSERRRGAAKAARVAWSGTTRRRRAATRPGIYSRRGVVSAIELRASLPFCNPSGLTFMHSHASAAQAQAKVEHPVVMRSSTCNQARVGPSEGRSRRTLVAS